MTDVFTFPASFAQQRLWFLDRLEGGGPTYNTPVVCRISGALDVNALERSLTEILGRHEALRTALVDENGTVVQRVFPLSPEFSVPVVQIAPGANLEVRLNRAVVEEVRKRFDLSVSPLFRARLFRISDVDHVLAITSHHVVFDGWSEGVLLRELKALYEAFRQGQPAPLEELPIQFADFTAWQREQLAGADIERQAAYWRQRLAGLKPLDLPLDRPRPKHQTFVGRNVPIAFSRELTAALKHVGSARKTTLFAVTAAGFLTLLHRIAMQDDVAVGITVAGRGLSEVEPLIGFFANTLVLRADASGDPPFVEFVDRVRDAVIGAFANQDLQFERLVEESGVPRDTSRSPLFQVLFNQAPSATEEKFGDATLRPVTVDVGVAKFDLSVYLSESDGVLQGFLEYNTDLFDAATIERLIGQYATLLDSVAAEPSTALSRLALLTAAEREQRDLLEAEERRRVLVEWNQTKVDYPTDVCLHELIQAQAQRTPEAIAVTFEGQSLSYHDLDARANRLARHLRALGVGRSALVGICAERSIEMVVGLLGILKAGGAYVPIDPTYPPERVAFMLEDAGVSVLLTQERLVARLPKHGAKVFRLDTDEPELHAYAATTLEPVTSADGLAYMIYTSGSTGRPKGALNAHRGIVNRLLWMQDQFHLTSADTVLQKTPMSFDVSVWEFFWPLLAGARLVVARPEGHRDPAYLVETIVKEKVTVLHFVPSMLRSFVEASDVERCGSLRDIMCSGEALPPDLVRDVYARLSAARINNLYGPTEAAVDVTYWPCPRDPDLSRVPIGRPIANTTCYILDEHLKPVPMGAPGELFLGGVQVGRGYHNRPDLTAERFIADPFGDDPQGRLYRTGDLCRYLPGGDIEYLGRLDFQVKIRGFRIELGEIESRLREHAAVTDCVVVAWTAPAGDQRLVAYVVTRGQMPSAAELKAHIAEKLPEHMVPSMLIPVAALPLSPSGKVDRKALPDPQASMRELAAIVYEAPRGEMETTIARAWESVLGAERVGRHDNFFEQGDDDVLLLRMVSLLREMGVRVSPADVRAHPTVAGLAQQAVRLESSPAPASEYRVEGDVPLTPIQRWFFEAPPPNVSFWNQAQLLDIKTAIDPRRLEEALNALAGHHASLRLRFERRDDGTWRQWYGKPARIPLMQVDLASVATEERATALEAIGRDLHQSLDIGSGHNMAAAWIGRGSGESPQLAIVAHHLVVDAVSWWILLEDLETAYRCLDAGKPVLLPAGASFGQWSERLSAHARSEHMSRESAYWRDVEAHRRDVVVADGSGGENREASTRIVSVELSPKDTELLLREAPKAYGTRGQELWLSALAQALGEGQGAEPFTVDVEGHGRDSLWADIDVTRTVGWFTSLYPVLLQVPKDARIADVIRTTMERMRLIPGNGLGCGVLRYLQSPESPRGGAGVASQVTFNFLGDLDRSLAGGPLFAPAHNSLGSPYSPLGARRFTIEVVARIRQGCFQAQWHYSPDLHREESIARVAERFAEALREIALEVSASTQGAHGRVAPGTPTETGVAAAFAEVLGIPDVGADDDFFGLGGHSLLAIKLMSKLASQFRVELPLATLFDLPTVSALAHRIDSLTGVASARDGKQSGPSRPPRTPTEQRLHSVWQGVLGSAAFGAVDNFLELQKPKDLVEKMVAAVRAEFGVYAEGLPVTDFLAEPTIESLARIIDGSRKPPSGLVVPLQPKGNRRPLFLIHAAGGYVFFYRALAQRLGPDRPVYAVRAVTPDDRGLGPTFEQVRSVEDLAAQYVSAIRTVQPEGPYSLGGACFGGVLAFEMARQLRAAGEQIAGSVLAFDSGFNDYLTAPVDNRQGYVASRAAEHMRRAADHGKIGALLYIIRKVIRHAPTVLRAAVRRMKKSAFADRVKWRMAALRGVPVPFEEVQRRTMQRFLVATHRLLMRYHPGRFDGTVALFPATLSPDYTPEWQAVTQSVTIDPMPGAHLDMMEEPIVATTAALVEKHLGKAGGGADCQSVPVSGGKVRSGQKCVA